MPEWKAEIRKRLAGLRLEAAREAEIVEELAQHLEDCYEELRAAGATDEEAYRAVLAELSESRLLAQELPRVARQIKSESLVFGARRMNVIGDLWQDLRYGLRMLRRNPGFTLVAVLSLALGIGANTAIFQLLDAVRLRTLPVKDPQELAEVRITDMTGTRGSFSSWHDTVTNPLWEQIRDRQQPFSGIFAWGTNTLNMAAGGEARYAQVLWVSGDFFNVLGVRPILGRVLTPADDRRGCGSPGAVISYSFWQRELGGDASVIGRKLTLKGHPLGASRGRLIRQLLAESLLLSAIGAALGAFLAQSLSRFLVSFLSAQGDPMLLDLDPDWRVLAFTTAMTILTCMLFGLTPAVRATWVNPGAAMKVGSRGLTAGRERFGLRRALVVSQVALSLVLLVGALLFSRSLGKLLTLDAGFRQDGILITNVALTRLGIPPERRQAFKQELLDRIRMIPDVDSAADTNIIPLGGSAWGNKVWMEGSDSDRGEQSYFSRVSPYYFKTLGTPLLAGRDFDDHDTAASPKVAIVNEAFARQLGNGANPVGKSFWVERTPKDPETLYEVVGLVKDAKYQDLREDFVPVAFLPTSQDPRPNQFAQILIRSNAPLAGLTSAVKRTIGEVNPEILIDFEVFQNSNSELTLTNFLMGCLPLRL